MEVNMKNRRRSLFAVVSIVVFLLSAVTGVLAADKYPSRPVTTIITFAPGGVADLTMRIWNKYLQKYLGGTFVTDYKPGGGGVVGYTAVANAHPDGYTLGNFPDIFLPVLMGTATYKMEDLQCIAQVDKNGSVLVVSTDAPWKTFQEFVDYCRANPGVKWGHQGTSTMIYFRTENLNREAKLKLTPVPLKGDSEIIAGLLGKHIQVGTIGAASAKAQTEGGKLRILFSFDPPKAFGLDPSIPDMVSFFKNSFTDVDVPVYLFAPKKTPPEVVAALQAALEKASKDPEFIKEEATISHYVEFVPGKTAMEQSIPKKMAIVKDIMKDIGMLK
jgi:tripartite-type tricarboxylate transporter receptor subunit TctC